MSVAVTKAPEVIPTGGPAGAEIRGIDASVPLDGRSADAVQQALHEHGVVYLRGQSPSDEQLVAFAVTFGPLTSYEVTEYEKPADVPPEIELIANIERDGKPIGALGSGEAVWHTDMSMFEFPASYTFLYGEQVPATGGNTRFTNLYRAFEMLPHDLRRKVEGRTSIHDAAHIADGRIRPPYTEVEDKSKGPGAHHPIVRTHPDTGRRALYLGRMGYGYVDGYSVEESDTLLDSLWRHMTRPELIWEHEWRVGDILIWDNRGVAHSRRRLDATQPRLMRRLVARGERPF